MRGYVLALIGLLALGSALVPPPAVQATDGYVYGTSSGYYYKNGAPYTRSDIKWYKDWYWVNAYYDSYGCYKPGYWSYSWKSYYDYTPVQVKANGDWRSKLLDIAHDRDKIEGDLRKQAAEQQYFESSVRVLGLEGNFRWDGYGTSPYNYASYSQLSAYGVQGTTVYGYSYKQAQDAYGQTDLNLLYQQYGHSVERAQQLAGQAQLGMTEFVKLTADQQARLAEINVRGAIMLEALKATPQVKTETKVFSFGSVKSPGIVVDGNPKVQVQGLVDQAAFLKLAGPGKCVDCHSGKQPRGGWSIETYHPWTASKKERDQVQSYLVKKDGCPKGMDKLTFDETMELLVGPPQDPDKMDKVKP